MNLLQKPRDREYPTEYLLSRIRGRKIRYRDSIIDESLEGVWRRLLKEYQWVYLQMNKGLYDIFLPFFIYSELKTVFICLRHKTTGDEKINEILKFSLLSEELKELLKGDSGMPATIEGIENSFVLFLSKFDGLREIFIKDGFMGLEQKITNAFLERVITMRNHPVIRDFFTYIIDSRNIITLYKHLRWGMGNPLYLSGGSIKEKKLMRIFEKQDSSGISSLIHDMTGIMIETPDSSNVENSLHHGMTVCLKSISRDPLCVGLILYYLWRCYMETINQSIILCSGRLDRDIAMELIY